MRTIQRLLPDILVITALFLLPLGFFWQQTLGGRTLIPTENLFVSEPYATYREVVRAAEIPHNDVVSDLILQNYQWKSFFIQQLGEGEVALWNPHQFSGIPFLAAGQHSMLYPLSVLYLLLPLWLAYGWYTVLNLWLAGGFMYGFMRALGVRRSSAMLAGVIYQLGGFVLASVVFQMMIGGLPWLPLMLLAAEYVIRRRRIFQRHTVIPWVVLGAIALGMNILAGHVEITIYSLLITGYYAGIRWLWEVREQRPAGNWAVVRTSALALISMIGIGFALGAVQFLPLFEFAQGNWRAERSSYEAVVGFAHPPRDILQFVLPNFYGSPAHHTVLDVFSGERIEAPWPVIATDASGTALTRVHTDWGIKNYVEGALYLGILPLLLSAYALLDRLLLWLRARQDASSPIAIPPTLLREAPYRIIFALLALLSLSFMFGLPTYRLIYALPGINQLNSAFRWIYALTLAVAVLSAFGMDALIRRTAESRRTLEPRIGLGLMALSLLTLAGLAFSYVGFAAIEPTIERLLRSLARADFAFRDARMFYSYQFGNVAVFAVVLLLCGGLFLWIGRMRMYRRIRSWSVLAVALVAADLMIASWGFNPASDPELLKFEPPVVQWLRAQYDDAQPFRYTTLEDPNQGPLLNANVTWRYGLDDVRGYDSIIPAQYMDYMQSLAPQVQQDFNRVAPLYTNPDYNHTGDYPMALDSPLLDLLNVRYVVAHPDAIVPFEEWRLAYEDEAVRVWENDSAVPRAYLVAADAMPQSWLPPQSAAPDRLARDVIPPYEAVRYTQDTGRERFLAIDIEQESWLVISENYAPGWKAFLQQEGAQQEEPLVVERVAGIFQGVALPAGAYTVRLVYSPTSFQVGLFGSVMGVIVITLMLGIWLWQIFVGVNTENSSQTAKVARNSIAPILLNLFNRGIDFVLAIIIYRLLSQEMVGVYNLAVVIFVWFDIFTNFGLDVFMMREVSRERSRSSFYLFNTSFLRFWLSVLGAGLLLLFLLLWQATVENPLPQEGLIALALLYVGLFPASLNKGVTSLYYAFEQAEKPAAIATITSINRAVFSVIVLLLGWGIIGLAGLSILNNFITLGVLLWAGRGFLGKSIPRRPDYKLLRLMMAESWPLMLNHFLATIFFQIDIVILQAMRGARIVAEYATAYKWLLAINIIPAFFTQALFPLLSRQAEEDREAFRRTVRFGLKLMVAIALPVAVGFTALATPLTLLLAGPAYVPNGAIALTIMIWSIPIGWMNSLTQYALIALNLQRWITRAFFGAVSFNIISNIIFIPQFGFSAAAVTTIFSELALFIPFAWLMHRGLQQPLNWPDLLWRPVVATAIMTAIIIVMWGISSILGLFLGSIVYLLVLIALQPLDQQERDLLRPMLPPRIASLPLIRTRLL